jgi:signal transduction histidine kinase/HAMP domain-containing protein
MTKTPKTKHKDKQDSNPTSSDTRPLSTGKKRRFWHIRTIRSRLLLSFIALVVLPIASLDLVTTLVSRENMEQRVIAQLESVATLKEAEMQTWLDDLQSDLTLAYIGLEDRVPLYSLWTEDVADPITGKTNADRIRDRFDTIIDQMERFEELFVMDEEGRVLLSSDKTQEGNLYSHKEFFVEGWERPFVQPPSDFPPGHLSVVVSLPIFNDQGRVTGVLAGRAALAGLNSVMQERAGLGETGETYLVNKRLRLLTPSRFPGYQAGIDFVRTDQGAQALSENESDLSGIYLDYRDQRTIGVYRWISELDTGLIAKQDVSEAFRVISQTMIIEIGLGALLVVIAVGAALFVTRSITNPLDELAQTATEIAGGNLDLEAPVHREDETGAVAQAFNSMTAQLRGLINSLEDRVAQRTRDLQRRSTYLEASAQVSRAAASILETDRLINEIVELVRRRFDLYYVGLFLVDETGQLAVLRAGTGQAGKAMLARGHQMEVGTGMIGWSIANAEPRVALEAGEDAVRLATPELPKTRSEAALPLRSRDRVLGALSVQSERIQAFDEDTLTVLQTMADQVAVAMDNARLFAETQEALEATRRAYGEISREAWIKLLRYQPGLGYRRVKDTLTRVDSTGQSSSEPPLHTGLEESQKSTSKDNGHETLNLPLKVRDHVIGHIQARKSQSTQSWTEEELELLDILGEQLGIALEGARLYQESQRHASREQLTGEIVAKIRAERDIPSILDTVTDELVQALDLSHVQIQRASDVSDDLFAECLPESDPASPSDNGHDSRSSGTLQEQASKATGTDRPEADTAYGPTSLAVPVNVNNQVVGVLELERTDQKTIWTEDELALVQAVVDQLGQALHNAQLFEQTQASLAETAHLYEATGRLSQADTIDQVLQVLDEEVEEAIGSQFNGNILLAGPQPSSHSEASREPGTGILWVEAVRQLNASASAIPVGTRIPVDDFPALQDFIGTMDPSTIKTDELIDQDEETRQVFVNHDIYTLTAVPLIAGDTWLGFIALTSQRDQVPDERVIRFIQNLADRAAVALQSIRLYQETQRHAIQLEAAAKISRATTSILDSKALLPSVVELIRDHFNYYHAQVFIIDETQSWAVLEASTGEIGQRLLKRGHSLEVGSASVVGYATGTGEAKIAADVTLDPTHIRNELLPNTRSEMAIPIKIGGRVIGALDVQSTEPAAFSPDDVTVLSALADQLAIAIENARLYQSQVETSEKLREVDQMKSQFLANMSHELRTPLNSIIGFSRVILKGIDGPLTDLQKQDLTAIYSSGQHLLGLINDILDLSKIEAGKMELNFEEVDLEEIAKGVMSTAIALVKDKPQVELRQTLAPDLPTIIADATRTRQVLLNLISNAAKFTDEGYIELIATSDDQFVFLTVKDTGIGIPEDKFETLFKEFEQVDGSSTRAVGGTGLGLPISRRFIELHGGNIQVKSEVGVGSEFTIQLPIQGPSDVEGAGDKDSNDESSDQEIAE